MSETVDDATVKPDEHGSNTGGSLYAGAAQRCLAMPLGGIGAGQIALCGDGGWRQWQIVNQANHNAYVPHSFFAISVRDRTGHHRVNRVLMSDALYDDSSYEPVKSVSDHLIPEGARELLNKLPGVESTQFVGEYPVAEIIYDDPSIPVSVRMRAFSPFEPLNSKDSGLPGIVCTFGVENPTDGPVEVTLAATLQNIVGWDGLAPIVGVGCGKYGGNSNHLVQVEEMTAVHMTSSRLDEDAPGFGSMCVAVLENDATYLTQWDDVDRFWADFSSDGHLDNLTDSTPSPGGQTWNGALAAPFWLQAKETKELTFLITWHFPNHYVNWDQKWFGIDDEKSRFHLGHQYSNWFSSALHLAEYMGGNIERLIRQTEMFRQTAYDTTLPHRLIDAAVSQTSIIRSPTVLWTEDGVVHGFEGCHGASTSHGTTFGGCCPMNCTHVWNYEQVLARLFPDLERTMRATDLGVQLDSEGKVIFRTPLPVYLPRKDMEAADGQAGTILKSYREFRASGDHEWLGEHWAPLKQAMEFIWQRWDQDGDGIMDGNQHNTYDIDLHGHNSFTSGLYLAALRAMEEMALLLDDPDVAEECRRRFDTGTVKLDEELFNGEYYIQTYDEETVYEHQYGIGCLSDQLLGQWWAHILDLGYILPQEHVRTALRSVFDYNWRTDFEGHVQQPRIYADDWDQGLLNCTWPHGGRPETPIIYSDEIWTGVEYQVAAHMLWEGMDDLAVRIVDGLRERYDGARRNPWNEVECGDHYARAMASWSVLEAAAGYRLDTSKGTISFGPRLNPDNFRAPWVASEAWGSFAQKLGQDSLEATISVANGTLYLKQLTLDRLSQRFDNVEVTCADKTVRCATDATDTSLTFKFAAGLTVPTGEKLVVTG